jgi:hypothetical protein
MEDREARKEKSEQVGDTPCFHCGKMFVNRGPRGDNSGRFCSDRCRAEYDYSGSFSFDPFNVTKWRVLAGGDPGYLVATPMMRMSGGGWGFDCCGCGKVFESTGAAYCKPGCRRASAERAEAVALMAEVGMDTPAKRQCQAPGCTNTIPRWRNGRAVPKATKFCSPACRTAAFRAAA